VVKFTHFILKKGFFMSNIITPYGGQLVDLRVAPERHASLLNDAKTLPKIVLSERECCDLELLAVGGFSPLKGFMNQADYQSVVQTLYLADGKTVFPLPITLCLPDESDIKTGDDVALCDRRNEILAVMRAEDVFSWDFEKDVKALLGTTDTRHPMVAEMAGWSKRFVGGTLQVLRLPTHYDFTDLRHTPAQTRALLDQINAQKVVAFQTRNPLHRAHEELTKRACEQVGGVLLLHPVVGMTKAGDVDHYTRVRAYKALVDNYYPADQVLLALLPLAMRMGGPREALLHMLIRRNYGASHFIVGRDHAGPGNDSQGQPFYGAYDAQDLAVKYAPEIGVEVIPFKMMVYLPDQDCYQEADSVPADVRTLNLSGTQVRDDYLAKGKPLPEWFTRPEVAQILAQTYPPRHKQGICIWFTGLSGAGKSTTAEILSVLLLEHGRDATFLDGDVVRQHLSKGLTFSREDRDANITRIGYVASEIVRHGGIAICAAISPYQSTRDRVRQMVSAYAHGSNFVEIFVDTPLSVCEERDTKGMYAKARAGEIKQFTGIDDPYEAPIKPEIVLDTVNHSAEENAGRIIVYLQQQGFI
jgi:sulfate adenylyltransferase